MSLVTPSLPTERPTRKAASLLAFGAVIAMLYFGEVFFVTVIIALIISLILEPAVSFFVRFRVPRGLASFIVCSIGLLIMYLLGLGLFTEASGLSDDLPAYAERINNLVDSAATKIERLEKSIYQTVVPRRMQEITPPPAPPPKRTPAQSSRRSVEPPTPPQQQPVAKPETTSIVNYAYSYLSSLYIVILMASFVPFLVYFMLSWRDHFRRAFLQLFEGQDRVTAEHTLNGVAGIARAYVLGNFVLGLFLGVLSSLFFFAIKLPYWLLIGPISGFLSLVPYVGLPLAMIPPVLAALPVYRELTMYLFIGTVVALIHLIALNLLYPKMVGSRVHLNPLVVTIALMFWTTLWGAMGLVLAIPITAGIKAVCDNVASLKPYGKLLGD